VPAEGQQWTTLDELTSAGHHTQLRELEPDLFGLTAEPGVGIGQQAHLVRTPQGNLLWDPPGYLDDEGVRRILELGEVAAIATSHPHMFGVQVEWSHALGGVPVLVAEPDLHWVARLDAAIRPWTGPLEVVPGITRHDPSQPGPKVHDVHAQLPQPHPTVRGGGGTGHLDRRDLVVRPPVRQLRAHHRLRRSCRGPSVG
jgi:hypothetical protein